MEEPVNIRIDPEQLLKDYKNAYWTRVVDIQDFEAGRDLKIPMGPDLVEECSAVADLPPADSEEWRPLFEPTRFNEANGPLTLEAFKLNPDLLRYWAETCSKMRKDVTTRSELAAQQEPIQEVAEQRERSLKGLKKSRPIHNLEHASEKELKQERQKDSVFKNRFKKRYRKDLSVEEIEEIIVATKQPYRLHKEVAKEFRVSHQLVSRLYQESLKGSKKIEE